MKKTFTLCLIFFSEFVIAQSRNNVWCFGDSAGINFNNINNPLPISTGFRTRGTCVSIADTNGQLLFYANDRASMPGFSTGLIWNKNHLLMQNGDSISGNAWYNEYVIVPVPGSSNLYYLFTIGVTTIYWLNYSIIDLSLNGGLGAVIQKNVQLQSFPMDDCLTTIKHGNGRDWWLLFRKTDGWTGGSNNDYYSYLVSPAGITNFNVQSVGTNNSGNTGNIIFNKGGDKFIYTNRAGMFEIYFFDRCTGIITLDTTVLAEPTSNFKYFFDGELSPNGNLFYVSTGPGDGHLIQFNLKAPDILASADTLWSQSYPVNPSGQLKRGPDDKIYFTCAYVPLTAPMYPYADSLYNIYNMNLGVINSPDSLGVACDFHPYSFYLGGKRTYWGLPNNPDYDLPRLQGSVCDTVQWTGLPGPLTPKGGIATLNTTYISEWQKLFVNAQNLRGENSLLSIFDLNGKEVYSLSKKTQPPYFTQDVNVSNLSAGMYVITLQTEKENLSGKFVK